MSNTLMAAAPARTVFYALGAAGSVAAYLLPSIAMPMRMMQAMRCHALMQPFACMVFVAILVPCVVCVVCVVRALHGPAK